MNKYIFILMVCLALFGCTEKEVRRSIPQANPEELGRSVFTLYERFDKVAPSGVILSTTIGGVRRYFGVTASHVMTTVEKHCNGGCLGFGFSSLEDIKITRRIEAPILNIPLFKFDLNKKINNDLGCYELTDALPKIKENKARITSIDIDSSYKDFPLYSGNDTTVVSGSGILLQENYSKFSVEIGTDLFAYCTDLSKTPTNNGYDWSSSKTQIIGKLALTNAFVVTNTDGGGAYVHIMKGARSAENGNSGGPVFAMVKIGDTYYPLLIGVIMGNIPDKPGETTVMPIDAIVHKITELISNNKD